MSIESEQFEAWLSHPITRAVMEKAALISARCRDEWMALSWGVNVRDLPKLPTEQLAYLRGKADAFESLSKLKSKDIFKETEQE